MKFYIWPLAWFCKLVLLFVFMFFLGAAVIERSFRGDQDASGFD